MRSSPFRSVLFGGVLALAASLVFGAVCLPTASAQQLEGESDSDQARRLFQEADRAIDEDRLADALDLLQRSMALVSHPATAFNLAMVHRGMGNQRAAVALLERLVAGDLGELPPQRRSEVAAVLDEVRSRLVALTITVRPADAVLRIDGEDEPALGPDGRLEARLDAGRHTVSARREDGRVVERQVELEPGHPRSIVLDFEALGSVGGDGAMAANGDTGRGDEGGDDGVLSSPWFWVGLAAVVIAGVVVVAYFAWPREPSGDPVWGVAQPLLSF